jgi:uncharacterized protein (TIGR04255 family)
MSKYPTLKHAPLIEALVDIKVDLADPSAFDLDRLAGFQSGLESRFPNRNELSQFNIEFKQDIGIAPHGVPGIPRRIGYQYFSGSRSVQCRVDGFTYSRLNGYDSWDEFEAEAKEYWDRYSNIVGSAQITRVALRFVNKIGVPIKCKYDDYFLTTPAVPISVATEISSFLMRLVLPQEDGIVAVATLATEPTQPDSTTSTVIFDIDVFLENVILKPNELIWDIARALRDIKNRIFFESITPLAKEGFE